MRWHRVFEIAGVVRMTDKAVEIANLLTPTVASAGRGVAGRGISSGAGQRGCCACTSTCPRRRPRGRWHAACGDHRGLRSVSREVSAQLDVEDPISSHYTLEVSSPGIDRPLFGAAQFARFAGESAKVALRLPQDGRRRMQARIARVEGENITFDVDGNEFVVRADNIEKARLVPDWAALGLSAEKTKPGKAPAKDKKSNQKPAAKKPSRAE
jgi:ribosome maturation factor RimP